jgi:hypothetical protein
MARLLADDSATEARAVSAHDLMHRVPEQDRDRILDRLNSRTAAEIERALALQRTAALSLAATNDRRSGRDRRSPRDRRSRQQPVIPGGERRAGRDRRSGRDRRHELTAS